MCGGIPVYPGSNPPHFQNALGQASRSRVVGDLGHTPNACAPKTQLSPSAFTSSGLSLWTLENPGEAMDTPPRTHTHLAHAHTDTDSARGQA